MHVGHVGLSHQDKILRNGKLQTRTRELIELDLDLLEAHGPKVAVLGSIFKTLLYDDEWHGIQNAKLEKKLFWEYKKLRRATDTLVAIGYIERERLNAGSEESTIKYRRVL